MKGTDIVGKFHVDLILDEQKTPEDVLTLLVGNMKKFTYSRKKIFEVFLSFEKGLKNGDFAKKASDPPREKDFWNLLKKFCSSLKLKPLTIPSPSFFKS